LLATQGDDLVGIAKIFVMLSSRPKGCVSKHATAYRPATVFKMTKFGDRAQKFHFFNRR
jgi:hypothetical protein